MLTRGMAGHDTAGAPLLVRVAERPAAVKQGEEQEKAPEMR
jgi:hypothetical protein